MKEELTIQETRQICAMYIGSKLCYYGAGLADITHYDTLIGVDEGRFLVSDKRPAIPLRTGLSYTMIGDSISLLLTPLEKITDEDAYDIFRLQYPNTRGSSDIIIAKGKTPMVRMFADGLFEYGFRDIKIEVYQYLLHKGYAVPIYIPRLNKSIDLFEYGIAKVKE